MNETARPRDFAAELQAARDNEDWDAHARIWEERRVASVEADEANAASKAGKALVALSVTITEACGSVWRADRTKVYAVLPARAFWVRFISGPRSAAKPGVIGFYAPSIEAAAEALNN